MIDPSPYRHALDGLDIPDPVAAFFAWCIDREAVRRKRAAGEPPPWTGDPVLRQGRFLNVFREDDPGTAAVLRFADPVRGSLPDLIHALFFARWCNRRDTLHALSPALLRDPAALRRALLNQVPQPWCSDVYPVGPVTWDGRRRDRLDACTDVLPAALPFLEQSIRAARGDVTRAVAAVNNVFRMDNDFPVFMAVIDLAWFRPDLIRPDSPVPTGIGARPYLDRLQRHLKCAGHHETARRMIALQPRYWPDAKRPFQPIDIEYLSCELRKYFSYVNGTKTFDGRNRFVPSTEPPRGPAGSSQ